MCELLSDADFQATLLKAFGTQAATVLRDLGVADHIVVSSEPDALDQIRSLTARRGVDIVLNNLGALDAWALSVGSLAVGGAAVTSGAKFGGRVEVDLRSPPPMPTAASKPVRTSAALFSPRPRSFSAFVPLHHYKSG